MFAPTNIDYYVINFDDSVENLLSPKYLVPITSQLMKWLRISVLEGDMTAANRLISRELE